MLTLQSKEFFSWQQHICIQHKCDIIVSNTGVRGTYAVYLEGETQPRAIGTVEELVELKTL